MTQGLVPPRRRVREAFSHARVGCVAVLAVAAVVVPSAQSGAATPVDWRLQSRVVSSLAELDSYRVVIELGAGRCLDGPSYRWKVDGIRRDVTARYDPGSRRRCHVVLRLDGAATHTVRIDAGHVATIAPDDHVVVAIGDSLARATGPCGPGGAPELAQAAELLAGGLSPASTVTTVDLTCPGATLARTAQLTTLRDLAGRHNVDAVVVQAGARDIGIDHALARCAHVRRCPRAPWRAGDEQSAAEATGAALAAVGERLDQLASGLRGLRISARRVVIVPYPDPTQGGNGRPCPYAIPGVSAAELRWVSEHLIVPLDAELVSAAKRHRWRVAGDARGFDRHGVCAPSGEAWARVAGHRLILNARGQLELAGVVARPLDRILRRDAERPKPSPARGLADRIRAVPGDAWQWFSARRFGVQGLIALAALAFPLVLALLCVGPTLSAAARLLRPSLSAAGEEASERGSITLPSLPTEWVGLAVKTLLGLASVLVSATFVAVVGAAILGVRFWSARLPVEDAISVVPRSQLLAVGAQALLIFAVLAVIATAFVWLLDGKGRAIRATRWGLILLIIIELVIAVVAEDFPARQRAWLIAAVLLAAVLLGFLVERSAWPSPASLGTYFPTSEAPGLPGWRAWVVRGGAFLVALAGLVVALLVSDALARALAIALIVVALLVLVASRSAGGRNALRVAVRLLPLAVLVAALYATATLDDQDRYLIPALFALAALLLAAPWGIAGGEQEVDAPGVKQARVTLVGVGLVCVVLLIARDEPWLAGAGVLAVILAGVCWLVARTSGDNFLPYGLAVLLSVPLFGAVASVLQAWESPELQPVATLSKDLQHSACGLYVADDSKRLYLARVDLDELGGVLRPRPRRSRMTSLDSSELGATSVGPLQPIASAVDQALTLRRGLLRAADVKDADWLAGTSCEATGAAPVVDHSALAQLADRFQPELVLDRQDHYWPVPVRTIFSMQDRHRHVCRRVDDKHSNVCVRLNTQGDLPWAGGAAESIEYPAPERDEDERRIFEQALGSVDAQRSAMEYFLVTGGRTTRDPISIQYWFFYTYNRQPLPTGTGGRHQGDFESVGVLLSARTHRPRYVWMARHDEEGRVFGYGDPALTHVGDHPVIYVALGSHASYESCLRQHRPRAPGGLIDDRPACRDRRQLRLPPESTPLTDLARVSWACWGGLFGHRPGSGFYEHVPYLVADAPRSPLWQQHFGGVTWTPCDSVPDPGPREGPNETVLPDRTAARIRRHAGRLDPLIDDCADWFTPPATGAYVVACDPSALRTFVNTGLEDAGRARVRIDDGTPTSPSVGDDGIPAVRRAPATRGFGAWRIAVSRPTSVVIYAACVAHGAQLQARFRRVAVSPGVPLRIDDSLGSLWRLRRPDGTTVAAAHPQAAHRRLKGTGRRCETPAK